MNATRDRRGIDTPMSSIDCLCAPSALEVVRLAADVREQQVADIKRRLRDGTYTVSARVLARAMLGSKSGHERSRALSILGSAGHSMPNSGSSQRTPSAACGA